MTIKKYITTEGQKPIEIESTDLGLVKSRTIGAKDKQPRKKKGIDILKEMEGQEVWTNALGDRFGERVCVLVKDGKMMHGGKAFVPTYEEAKGVWDDLLEAEFGPKEYRDKMFKEEFGDFEKSKQKRHARTSKTGKPFFAGGQSAPGMILALVRDMRAEGVDDDEIKSELRRGGVPKKIINSSLQNADEDVKPVDESLKRIKIREGLGQKKDSIVEAIKLEPELREVILDRLRGIPKNEVEKKYPRVNTGTISLVYDIESDSLAESLKEWAEQREGGTTAPKSIDDEPIVEEQEGNNAESEEDFPDYEPDVPDDIDEYKRWKERQEDDLEKAFTKFPKYIKREKDKTGKYAYTYTGKEPKIRKLHEIFKELDHYNKQIEKQKNILDSLKDFRSDVLSEIQPIFKKMNAVDIETGKVIMRLQEKKITKLPYKELYDAAYVKLSSYYQEKLRELEEEVTTHKTRLEGELIKKSDDSDSIASLLNEILETKEKILQLLKAMEEGHDIVKSLPKMMDVEKAKKLYTDNLVSNRTEEDEIDDEEFDSEEDEDIGMGFRQINAEEEFNKATGTFTVTLHTNKNSYWLESDKGWISAKMDKAGMQQTLRQIDAVYKDADAENLLDYGDDFKHAAYKIKVDPTKLKKLQPLSLRPSQKDPRKKRWQKNSSNTVERSLRVKRVELMKAIQNRDTSLIKSLRDDMEKTQKRHVRTSKKGKLFQAGQGSGVHLRHCNQGEYKGTCKYGEDKTCPALKGTPKQLNKLDFNNISESITKLSDKALIKEFKDYDDMVHGVQCYNVRDIRILDALETELAKRQYDVDTDEETGQTILSYPNGDSWTSNYNLDENDLEKAQKRHTRVSKKGKLYIAGKEIKHIPPKGKVTYRTHGWGGWGEWTVPATRLVTQIINEWFEQSSGYDMDLSSLRKFIQKNYKTVPVSVKNAVLKRFVNYDTSSSSGWKPHAHEIPWFKKSILTEELEKSKKKRKHTPIVSRAQQKFFGAEYARAKEGKKTQSGMKAGVLKEHLEESKGKFKGKSILRLPLELSKGPWKKGKKPKLVRTKIVGSHGKYVTISCKGEEINLPKSQILGQPLVGSVADIPIGVIDEYGFKDPKFPTKVGKSKGPWKKGKKETYRDRVAGEASMWHTILDGVKFTKKEQEEWAKRMKHTRSFSDKSMSTAQGSGGGVITEGMGSYPKTRKKKKKALGKLDIEKEG